MSKSDYRIALEWYNSLGSLVKFNPQPRSLGVRYTRRTYLGEGGMFDEGPFIELLWSALDNDAQYRAVLTQFDLVAYPTRKVTIYARDELWQYHIYNGVAHRPALGSDANWEYMPKDVTVLVRELVLMS